MHDSRLNGKVTVTSKRFSRLRSRNRRLMGTRTRTFMIATVYTNKRPVVTTAVLVALIDAPFQRTFFRGFDFGGILFLLRFHTKMSSSLSSSSLSTSLVPATLLSRDQAIAAAEHPQHNPCVRTPPPVHSTSYILGATFASAGLGNAISAACTNPADIIKVRQQLLVDKTRANFVGITSDMIRKEGLRSLWNGVTASCLRELTYSTVRFGLYESFKDAYAKALGVADSSFTLKALSGISSGAIGSAFACPTDLVKGERSPFAV